MSPTLLRDSQDRPLRFFHGTKIDFLEFDVAMSEDGGLHFGTAEQASYRAGWNNALVIPVYLAAEKIMRQRDDGRGWRQKIARAKAAGADAIVYLNRFECMSTQQVVALSEQGLLTRLDAMTDAQFLKVMPEAKESIIVFHHSQVHFALAQPDGMCWDAGRRDRPHP